MSSYRDRSGGRRGHLPSPAELVDFIRESPSAMGRREIARAFGLAPENRPALRALLRQAEQAGALARAPNRRFVAGRQPSEPESGLATVERMGSDEDGVPLVRPLGAPEDAPRIRLIEVPGDPALPIGGRAAVRLSTRENGETEARLIRRLDPVGERIVGIYRTGRDGARLVPADRRNRAEYRVSARDGAAASEGELVVAEALAAGRFGPPRARIVERLGAAGDPGSISALAIAEHDIPSEFPPETLTEAAAACPAEIAGRADLRRLPLVTIDGSDARDFDDAVWAEPDPDPGNRGGWHLVVAIADVAAYVAPGGALDREARRRGNSVYFPDRVVPMLPEALSNELCSLKPQEDRLCLAAHLWIDAEGRKRGQRFERAVMRSAARLTYEEAQRAQDGGGAPGPIVKPIVTALYGAYRALAAARARRGVLELDIPENRIVLDADGRPAAVVPAARLDSHRLIEEFMILANVAAAEELERRQRPCLYRIHDTPDPEKLRSLSDFLAELGVPGLSLAKGQVIRPALFNRIIERAAATPAQVLINELVLRCQAQAAYSPGNIGHFGLALPRYVHFTSPIRRYADLLVHRALTADDRAPATDGEALTAVGEHISATERRAAAAERTAIERYRASLLAGSLGEVFAARISGVASFGLFVAVAESGTQGLVPISSLSDDYYDCDRRRQLLVGRRSGRRLAFGDEVRVRLVEADGIGGRLVFHLEGPLPKGGGGRSRGASRSQDRRRR